MICSSSIFILCVASCVFLPAHSYSSDTLGVLQYADSETSNSNVRIKRQTFTDNVEAPTTTPITSVIKADTTDYYDIEYISAADGGADLWTNLQADGPNVVKHKSLQQAYRLAVKIDIGFSFLFYGHSVNHVTVATGGFLYMSDFLHSFLTASQYVAPLMANFDTNLGKNESEILFRTDDQAFIAQWNNVYLKDKPQLGKFSFQVQLHRTDGRIVAAYKDIPAPIANVSSADHPVKIGLSDAYYWDRGQYRTIYPYHTYNASAEDVKSNSAIIYKHKPTCNMLTDCDECLSSRLGNFQCYWCSALNRCSDAFDRQRQDWFTNGCVYNVTQTDCDMMFAVRSGKELGKPQPKRPSTSYSNTWKAVTAALCTIFALTAASVLAAVVYGYRNPQSTLGQFLVKNRPSELWRKFKSWKDKDEESSADMNHI